MHFISIWSSNFIVYGYCLLPLGLLLVYLHFMWRDTIFFSLICSQGCNFQKENYFVAQCVCYKVLKSVCLNSNIHLLALKHFNSFASNKYLSWKIFNVKIIIKLSHIKSKMLIYFSNGNSDIRNAVCKIISCLLNQ